jgi:hypothetical protein
MILLFSQISSISWKPFRIWVAWNWWAWRSNAECTWHVNFLFKTSFLTDLKLTWIRISSKFTTNLLNCGRNSSNLHIDLSQKPKIVKPSIEMLIEHYVYTFGLHTLISPSTCAFQPRQRTLP